MLGSRSPRLLFIFQTLDQLVDLLAHCPNAGQKLQQLGFVVAHPHCDGKPDAHAGSPPPRDGNTAERPSHNPQPARAFASRVEGRIS
jgi:hypothetical protein